MKKTKYIGLALALTISLNACEQEVMELKKPEPVPPAPACPDDATAGTANFTKFIAIGNSFVAGVQGGALFTDGQNSSLPLIMNKQLECVGAAATFNQPTIGASLGWNLFIPQPILTDPTFQAPVLGRMLLQYGTNVSCATGQPSPLPTPQAYASGNYEAVPNPQLNPGFIYTGGKANLNNFGVPAVTLGQLLTPATGNWADPDQSKGFNPFYARLAFPPTGSTIIGDAAAAGGTFFLFWAGLDDFLLYAAFGADPTKAPLTPASGGLPYGFDGQYVAAVGSLLASNPDLKGVLGNFPDIFKMPHFTSVSYNPIPLPDQSLVDQLNTGFGGYNAALDGLVAFKAQFGISDELAAEIQSRKVFFEVGCNNKILLIDETLTDLGPYFDGLRGAGAINDAQRAGLVPYEQVRHSMSSDVIPLSAGSVLGEPGTFGVLGVSEPVGDQYVIIPSEKDQIDAARTAYNNVIANFAASNSSRLALADINTALNEFVGYKSEDGVTITPNINPPTGIYSEDGLHPNTRGYAFLADVFINAINAKFGSKIPSVDLARYSATGLPIP